MCFKFAYAIVKMPTCMIVTKLAMRLTPVVRGKDKQAKLTGLTDNCVYFFSREYLIGH